MILLRVLWGEGSTPGSRWNRVWNRNIRVSHIGREQPDEQHIYVYGQSNADILTKNGFSNIKLVDKSPWPDGESDSPSLQYKFLRPWHYKFELIQEALQDHGKIVYCDWDVGYEHRDWNCVETSLADRESAFTAYWYKKSRHPSRKTRRDQRIAVSGSWLYFTNTTFVDEVLKAMNGPEEWAWHDEFTMGNLLDRKHGGWMGDVCWLENYESPIMVVTGYRSPWLLKVDDGYKVTRDTPINFEWKRIFVT